ncbi:sugar porter family MFS transporter [Kitasatospora sp. NBC_01302]|uniref:sugar porter family MFS transporter n=1 Tax=Kitasatospora sp. NBC_01302 TaxID=2903575 RepID=UPI002E12FD09|nr:sugar porter family MFS transporter [Kitasatospora sp. NBC_01302]
MTTSADIRSGAHGAHGAPGVRRQRVSLVCGAAAMAGFLFGYDSAVVNGAITAIQRHFHAGTAAIGLTVSAALLGAAAGAWTGGALADRLGRLRVMQIAAVLFVISAVGSLFPFALWDLALWRVLGGIAIGIASVIAPTYITEIAPPARRGRYGSFQQLAIVLGICCSQLVDYALTCAAGGDTTGGLGGLPAWRWMLGICAVPALAYLVLTLRIPESPRWLAARGRVAEAAAVLARLEGGEQAVDRIEDIRASLRRSAATRPRLRDLCGGCFGLLPVVWLGIGLSVLSQFVGINVIVYYASVLWQSTGISQSDSLLISLSTSVTNIVGTLIAVALVDRVGRKPLIVAGSVGMTVSLAAVAWAFSGGSGSGGHLALPALQGQVALVAAHAFVLCFAFSWGAVLWVLLGELFPNRLRALALAVAVLFQWLANWAVTVSFPLMAQWNLTASYIVYAAFAALSVPFAVRFLKETRGRRLEELEESVGESGEPWRAPRQRPGNS